MKEIISVIIVLVASTFIINGAFAQSSIKLSVRDSITEEQISTWKLYSYNEKRYFTSNERGEINLMLEKADTLFIKTALYKDKLILLNKKQSNSFTIDLMPKYTYLLDEVTVKGEIPLRDFKKEMKQVLSIFEEKYLSKEPEEFKFYYYETISINNTIRAYSEAFGSLYSQYLESEKSRRKLVSIMNSNEWLTFEQGRRSSYEGLEFKYGELRVLLQLELEFVKNKLVYIDLLNADLLHEFESVNFYENNSTKYYSILFNRKEVHKGKRGWWDRASISMDGSTLHIKEMTLEYSNENVKNGYDEIFIRFSDKHYPQIESISTEFTYTDFEGGKNQYMKELAYFSIIEKKEEINLEKYDEFDNARYPACNYYHLPSYNDKFWANKDEPIAGLKDITIDKDITIKDVELSAEPIYSDIKGDCSKCEYISGGCGF